MVRRLVILTLSLVALAGCGGDTNGGGNNGGGNSAPSNAPAGGNGY